ncbi:DUF2189 domain-containing protein [Primorskyibacter marinus]|uniref:DUF2189 domain-containing protein n=1 Tax=Primorskyibacter marinus TaxID=1977320 RepID=UPI000E309B1E|nr:DUF2189 domain-containing protein [Primorskyibacter marinus]
MAQTIGNPLSWAANALHGTGQSLGHAAESVGGESKSRPVVNDITMGDVRAALRSGMDDFTHFRSDVVFLVVLYPLIGIALAYMAFNRGLMTMIFPMAAGFALLGPVAGIGLYELSRRREAGQDAGWNHVLSLFRSDIMGRVLTLGAYLLGLFFLWMYAAVVIYDATLGPAAPVSASAFLTDVLRTGPGWTMIILGFAVGFVFALAVLVVSLTTFPMIVDRKIGLPVAVMTSVAVCRRNPVAVAGWGLTVAVLLALGSIPFFLGLIVVLPVLGHATWHLYRRAVSYEAE